MKVETIADRSAGDLWPRELCLRAECSKVGNTRLVRLKDMVADQVGLQ